MAKRHLNAGKPNGKARWPNRPAAYFGKIARELEAMQPSGVVVTRDPNTLRRLFSQLFTRGGGDAINRSPLTAIERSLLDYVEDCFGPRTTQMRAPGLFMNRSRSG